VTLTPFCRHSSVALFIWPFVPRTWNLLLWTTLAASVNADK
jgi:hypothetical protein